MEVEWNNAKAASNLAKHGIDFRDATNIFLDPNRVERQDPRLYTETRVQVIGLVNDVVLFVVYTERGECYRIISARRASKDERRRYDENQA